MKDSKLQQQISASGDLPESARAQASENELDRETKSLPKPSPGNMSNEWHWAVWHARRDHLSELEVLRQRAHCLQRKLAELVSGLETNGSRHPVGSHELDYEFRHFRHCAFRVEERREFARRLGQILDAEAAPAGGENDPAI